MSVATGAVREAAQKAITIEKLSDSLAFEAQGAMLGQKLLQASVQQGSISAKVMMTPHRILKTSHLRATRKDSTRRPQDLSEQ